LARHPGKFKNREAGSFDSARIVVDRE